jgi:hypothetical protein
MAILAREALPKFALWVSGIGGAGLLLFGVAGYAAWTGSNKSSSYTLEVNGQAVPFGEYLDSDQVDAAKALVVSEESTAAAPMVHLMLRRLDPQTGQLAVDVEVILPQVMFDGTPSERAAKASQFHVSYWSLTSSSDREDLPSAQGNGDYVIKKTVTVSGIGSQADYPADSYYFGLGLGMMGDAKPSFVTVRRSPELNDLDVSAKAYSSESYYIALRRDNGTQWFTYSVALAPLLLLISMFALQRQEARASIAGLAVGALAMLPLRQVLVPATISQRTSVDVLLACEFMIFIASAAITIFFTSRRAGIPQAETGTTRITRNGRRIPLHREATAIRGKRGHRNRSKPR